MNIETKRKIMSNKFIKSSYTRFIYFLYKHFPKTAVKIEFRLVMGYSLNLKNPKTMNEKIQYLKFYDNTDLKKRCADKYEVRGYIKEKGLDDILNGLIGIYNTPNEIDFNSLPNQFVLKNTRGSGCNMIVKDKNNLNENDIMRILESWMNKEFGIMYYEPQYIGVKPRIIVEEYLEDEVFNELPDYKVYCSNGEIIMTEVIVNRFKEKETNCYHFDKEWNYLESTTEEDEDELNKITKPKNYEYYLEVCKKLSEDFKFVRVDLYIVNDHIYFGELTFTSKGGFDNDFSKELDIEIGKYIKL